MPEDAPTPTGRPRRTIEASAIALVVVWIAFLLRVSLHSFAFVILLLVLLVARAWRPAALVLALSPPVVIAVLAGAMFAQGTARLMYTGLPSSEFHNPDPQTRLPRGTMGDLVSGEEWLAILPNNLTVRGLQTVFGPMPGSYTGPYPDRAAAFAALEHARPIPAERLLQDVVVLDGREIHLDTGVGRGLVRSLHGWAAPAAFDAAVGTEDRPAATLYEERCLILRLPRGQGPGPTDEAMREHFGPEGPGAIVALVDVERGRPFAYYAPKSGPAPRYPPVRWHPEE